MGFANLIAEQRDRQVLDHARPHLDDGEEVIHWVRAHHPSKRRQGYAFLTRRRLLVVWSASEEGRGGSSPWTEVHAWGVDTRAGGGPLLAVESSNNEVLVHMPVGSRSTARRVTSFLRRIARLAPKARPSTARAGHSHPFHWDPAVEVTLDKMSARALTRRAIVTVIGLALFFGGLAIVPIPGPWSLPVMLAGLAVLSSEYDWAKDLLELVRSRARAAREKLKARRAAR
jgi:hypothetical protein